MKLRNAWLGALALSALMLAGCSGDEVSVRITEKENQFSGVVNAVLAITAETDGVAIKTLTINGGQCHVIYGEHKPVLNTGQQNTYTLSQSCHANEVTHVDVKTEKGTSSFTF